MSYMKKEWVSRDKKYKVVEKYHSMKCLPSSPSARERRRKRTGEATPVKQELINLRVGIENLTRKILDNFKAGDWWICFTLSEVVSVERFKKEYRRMMKELRKFFKEKEQELKYVAVQENLKGVGRMHGHILINGQFPFMEINERMKKVWRLGACKLQPYGGGIMDARKLAGYMMKEATLVKKLNEKAEIAYKERITGISLQEEMKRLDLEMDSKRSNVCVSKNLESDKPTRKEITSAETYREEMKPPKGWRIVQELSFNGYTQDGYPYQKIVLERFCPHASRGRCGKERDGTS